MKSAKAAFRANKESKNASDHYFSLQHLSTKCLPKCEKYQMQNYAEYNALKNAKNVTLCQLPFNKTNLNVNLVTKNDFQCECVIQSVETKQCNPPLSAALSPPYLYYNLYHSNQKLCQASDTEAVVENLCVLNNNNNNRIYYPA
jgi:hypothetical protein